MMIAHYAGAIEMSRAELRAGRNPQLRRLAEEITVKDLNLHDLAATSS